MILYPSPIFGPVHSRRLGISLGINLMPADGKLCSFDCAYCECGFNGDNRPQQPRPTREAVAETLENKLIEMTNNGEAPDVLTFAGNGEPTLHIDFADIVDDVLALRDKYCAKAKVSVLSNATAIQRQSVFEALMKVDNNIQKLDTVNLDFIHAVDRPNGAFDVENVIENLARFNGHVIIQTMFLTGWTNQNFKVDNVGEDFVNPWLDALDRIKPSSVMIYTIDRRTPDEGLRKAKPEVLDAIAEKVRERGFECNVAY